MSDDAELDQLLENFQKVLDGLEQIGDVEGLISRLDAKNDRKLLKKVKGIVSDIHTKVNSTKEKVSRVYKRVKSRCNLENDDCTARGDEGSDREVTEDVSSLEESIDNAGKVSPDIEGKGKKKSGKKGEKKDDKEDKGSEEAEKVINKDKHEANSEEQVSHKEADKDDSPKTPNTSVNQPDVEETPDKTTNSDKDDEIIEPTPEKMKSLRIRLTLPSKKNNESTIVEDRSAEVNNEKPAEKEDEGKDKKRKRGASNSGKKDSNKDSEEGDDEKRKDSLKIKLSSSKKNKDNNESVVEILDSTREPTTDEDRSAEVNDEKQAEKEDEGTDKKRKRGVSNSSKKDSNKDSEEGDDEKRKDSLKIKLSLSSKKNKDNNESVVEILDSTQEEGDDTNKDLGDKSEKEGEAKDASANEDVKVAIPKIKLVDISKLLAPNKQPMEMTPTPTRNRKSVTFDSSVIVLTSSDEDTPKKNPKEKESTPLKSALRKSSPKVADLSDSDSKENNENLRNRKRTTKKPAKKHSSDDDSELEGAGALRRRLRRHEKSNIKDSFSQLVQERNKRSDRYLKRNEDKNIRNGSSKEDKTKGGKKRKKELLEESSLSEDSDSDSDRVESEVRKSGKNSDRPGKKSKKVYTEADPNDPKFQSEVFIRLPKFKCEDLPELYRKRKETFEVKRLCKMTFSRRTRKKDETNAKTSDDSDNPEPKKIKLTLKLNNKKKDDDREEESDQAEVEDGAAEEEKSEEDVDMPCLPLPAADDGVLAQLAVASLETSDEEPTEKEESNETAEESGKKDETMAKVNGILSDSDDESQKTKDKSKKDEDKSENGATDDESDKEEEATTKTNKKKGKQKAIAVIDSSDSDVDFSKFSKKNDKSKGDLVKEAKKRMKKKAVLSDSESEVERKKSGSDDDKSDDDKGSSSTSDDDGGGGSEAKESDKEEDEEESTKKQPARKRIRKVNDSSSDDDDKSTRKHLRKMIDRDSLSETTKKAEQEEKERKARILEKQKKYNKIFELKADSKVDKVVLDFDEKTDKPLLSVHKKIVKHLKPHQVLGVKFMWDACFESLERVKKGVGSGCILAHCMGLGKTLQVIALTHTLLTNQQKSKVEKVLVVCPVNTVINWKNEFRKWMPNTDDFEVYELVSCKSSAVNQERKYIIECWHNDGGVLIIGYNMFRTLSNPDNKTLSKKLRASFHTGLVDPGPDMVVCDEGHLLKNEKSNLSIAMNRIKTLRRIVLTGTPLQNNLREYWCMVQFIKPNLLGTYKEYLNRFVNPITNGQYTDSTQHDIMIMRRRSHVLHKLLDGVVQRQDYAVLEPYLPPKYEFVLFLKLTEVQVKLYTHYMDNFARKNDGSNRTSFLFTDFQHFQRICTHPRVLLDKSVEDKEKKEKEGDSSESEGSIKDFIDDNESGESANSSDGSGSDSDSSGSGSGASVASDKKKKKKQKSKSSGNSRTRLTRAQAAQKRQNGEVSESEDEEVEVQKEWWDAYVDRDELDNINHSAKIFLLFQILKECEEIGDKVLVFSQSLYALNTIEYFLARIDEATQRGETDAVGGHTGSWALGLDYFRLDGSSSCDNRATWCDEFNDPENIRARLFLISTKAGGLGINLVAANRVIIFDVSWNPSHDIQSIYRVYRFGQTKPSYIYRFVTYGAMEMKIYERQVTKQAISKRVIDEQQIDRHYSQNDIQELYKTDLEPKDRPIPLVPKDVLLGEMLQKYDNTIFKFHEHQSLLENKQDEQLNEDERKAAWEEFENEKVIRKTTVTNFGSIHLGAINNSVLNFSPHLIQMALANIVRKDNPAWSEVQIKGILPALVTQLQVQMSENDFSMYNRVQQEIRLMQALQAQRMRENYMKQQLRMQQMTNQMLGNMNISPQDLMLLQQMAHAPQPQNVLQQQPRPGRSSDVIELND